MEPLPTLRRSCRSCRTAYAPQILGLYGSCARRCPAPTAFPRFLSSQRLVQPKQVERNLAKRFRGALSAIAHGRSSCQHVEPNVTRREARCLNYDLIALSQTYSTNSGSPGFQV